MSDQAHPKFDRRFFESGERFTCIGSGGIGGKASGLAFIHSALCAEAESFPSTVQVSIPTMAVVAADVFDEFIQMNDLAAIADSDAPDDRIAHAFQRASFPPTRVGDLRALVSRVHVPLAVRSSSLLEDAMFHPFAGVYATKMIPNNQPDEDSRFRKLIEAIKFVYSSTFFGDAKAYLKRVGMRPGDEKMAVIVQEVVGQRHHDLFYPHICGVARSHNYYPCGHATPCDGVVDLAMGLGKTIVDGGLCYSYSPAFPRSPPPYGSVEQLLENTQSTIWAVNMGRQAAHDPIRETEYMLQDSIPSPESDEALRFLASTYDAQSDRVEYGVGMAGPRILNFAPILCCDEVPLNETVRRLLTVCEKAVGSEVEIEFAVTLDAANGVPARLGFLQVRPMLVSNEKVDILSSEFDSSEVLLRSSRVLGNGVVGELQDIVYVKPEAFDAAVSRVVADEVRGMNAKLTDASVPYMLIGFGRWGSSDPWLGIPVEWSQICGARVMVEATLPTMNPDFSQGSHFFHNLSSFRVMYFSVSHGAERGIDWNWLGMQPVVHETKYVRHVRVSQALRIKVDGRSGRGVVLR